jgi:hypothetical protein
MSREFLTQSVKLTNPEILSLDGICRPETQAIVDAVKSAEAIKMKLSTLPRPIAELCGRIAAEAIKEGILEESFVRMSRQHCECCDAYAGYAPYKSTTYNHQKGDPNYKKPRYLSGSHFNGGFMCNECWDSGAGRALVDTLKDYPVEIPKRYTAGKEPKWRKMKNKECQCGWKGHEGEMPHEMNFYCNGTYPARCPACNIKNTPFGPTYVKTVDGHTMVEASKVSNG